MLRAPSIAREGSPSVGLCFDPLALGGLSGDRWLNGGIGLTWATDEDPRSSDCFLHMLKCSCGNVYHNSKGQGRVSQTGTSTSENIFFELAGSKSMKGMCQRSRGV